MRESDLLRYVTDCAQKTGWLCWHVPAPMRATRQGTWVGAKEAAGLPDLVLISEDPPRLILAELKSDKGKLSDEQQVFLKAARNVADISWSPSFLNEPDGQGLSSSEHTIGVYAWTPADMDTIATILKSRVLI